jgi:hypothetical protein
MEPRRAVRIWVRTAKFPCNKAVCRCAVCSSFQSQPLPHATAGNTVIKENLSCNDFLTTWEVPVAAVALANKNARILWAVFVRGKAFDARHVSIKPGTVIAVA